MTLPRHASSRPSTRGRPRPKGRSLRGSSLSPLPLSWTVSDSVISDFLITDIKQGVKNPNRANIFVNDQYSFSLDISQVVDFKLKVGCELSSDELAELKRASEFGKLYQRALEWVLVRPRSSKEVRDYLYKKIYEKKLDKKYIDEIVTRLESKGYVDDRRFAEFWVENRFVKKGVSRKRLAMELMKKGISKDIIDEVLDGRDDKQEILKIIARKRDKYDDEKLIAYLCRQGFPYQLVRSLVLDSEMD